MAQVRSNLQVLPKTIVGLDHMHVGRDSMATCRLTCSCFHGHAPLYNFHADYATNVCQWHIARHQPAFVNTDCITEIFLQASFLSTWRSSASIAFAVVSSNDTFVSSRASFSRNLSRLASIFFIFENTFDVSSKSATTNLVTTSQDWTMQRKTYHFEKIPEYFLRLSQTFSDFSNLFSKLSQTFSDYSKPFQNFLRLSQNFSDFLRLV